LFLLGWWDAQVPVTAPPVHLLRVRLAGDAHVLSCAVSTDGSTLAVSDCVSTKLFSLVPDTGARISFPPSQVNEPLWVKCCSRVGFGRG